MTDGDKKTIVVAGDIAVDWMGIVTDPCDVDPESSDLCENWKLYPGLSMTCHPGGVLLLHSMLKSAWRRGDGPDIYSYNAKNLDTNPPTHIIHSNCILAFYPDTHKSEKNDTKRIKKYCGYSGPDIYQPPFSLTDNPKFADIVIIDDSGNGFRTDPSAWPQAIVNKEKPPLVILKMSRPLAKGALWEELKSYRKDRLILVIHAYDLREEGGNISYCLSWERTVSDILWQLKNNEKLIPLTTFNHLVIRIGNEGVLYYYKTEEGLKADFWYTPLYTEDGIRTVFPGKMQGLSNAFIAGMVRYVDDFDNKIPEKSIISAMRCAWRLYHHGYGKEAESNSDSFQWLYYNPENISGEKSDEASIERVETKWEEDPDIQKISIPDSVIHFYNPLPTWTFLETVVPSEMGKIAIDWVKKGKNGNSSIEKVPIGTWGKLLTIDRTEIESYQSIRTLIEEYVRSRSIRNPLSIAVFGPPGSGKSFGVKQLAASIGKKEDFPELTFNLSQISSPDDLPMIFHKIRDVALEGKTPLVFFDEFDSSLQNKSFGWLKFFLAPMQDGLFRDGEGMHPLGKAIFVFAGGTCQTFKEFEKKILPEKDGHFSDNAVKDAKGTDFISRLRGFINIKGINKVDDNDLYYPIRRAIVLRSILERNYPQFITKSGVLMDPAIIHAFITTDRYLHGARSLEAIIFGSALSGKRFFDQSSLPQYDQLSIHVDANDFMKILLKEPLERDSREKLAIQVHADYIKNQEKNNSIRSSPERMISVRKKISDDLKERKISFSEDEILENIEQIRKETVRSAVKKYDADICPDIVSLPAEKEWNKITEDYRDSNRKQADDIIKKLNRCGYDVRPAPRKPIQNKEFNAEEVEMMAIMEHDRWMLEKKDAGWIFGKERDDEKKIHPSLIPWEKLPEKEREKDRNSVRLISKLMNKAGFEIFHISSKNQ